MLNFLNKHHKSESNEFAHSRRSLFELPKLPNFDAEEIKKTLEEKKGEIWDQSQD